MSAYAYAVTAKSLKLKQFFTHEKLDVRQAKFFCKDYLLKSADVLKIDNRYEKKGKAEYIVCSDDMSDLYGSIVYKYNGESGLFIDDRELNTKYEPVGIILGKQRAWYLETRKDVVEKINRQNQWTDMKAGKLSVGKFGYDVDAYEEWLYEQDKKAKAEGEDIFFQGWGIHL